MTMTERIIGLLQKCGIAPYCIREEETDATELFYIGERLDMKRAGETHTATVQVWVQKGDTMGTSTAVLDPGMDDAAMTARLTEAREAAGHARNPVYALPDPVRGQSDTDRFRGKTTEQVAMETARQILAASCPPARLNSAEIFARRIRRRIVTDRGTDVRYCLTKCSGEYVVQCKGERDAEMIRCFEDPEAGGESLTGAVREAMRAVCDREKATLAPVPGTVSLLLTGEDIRTVLSYFAEKSTARMVYTGCSGFQVGQRVQGETIEGDPLTVTLLAQEPYSREGIPMEDRLLLKEGTLTMLHGENRFCRYLNVPVTGAYDGEAGAYGEGKVPMAVAPGSVSMEELKAKPYLRVVSFSDFQMDALTGYFGGEIRLAYQFDGREVRAVTGGSVSGSILRAAPRLRLSRECEETPSYRGPKAMLLEDVTVSSSR